MNIDLFLEIMAFIGKTTCWILVDYVELFHISSQSIYPSQSLVVERKLENYSKVDCFNKVQNKL